MDTWTMRSPRYLDYFSELRRSRYELSPSKLPTEPSNTCLLKHNSFVGSLWQSLFHLFAVFNGYVLNFFPCFGKIKLTKCKLKDFPPHSWKHDLQQWILNSAQRRLLSVGVCWGIMLLTLPYWTLEMQRTHPPVTLWLSGRLSSEADGISF